MEDVADFAARLPDVTEIERHGNRTWAVAGEAFAWERPFSKADIKRFGNDTPPSGPILAVRVADLDEKDAALAENPKAFFTIPHFEGYAAILVQMRKVTKHALTNAINEGWLACAPRELADRHLGRR